MKGQTYTIIAIIVVIIVAIFAVANVEPVQVNFVFGSGEIPLVLLILFAVLMGGIITAAVGMIKVFRLERSIRKYKEENERLNTLLKENNLEKEAEMGGSPETTNEKSGDEY
ncbi:LapA family protein [Oceanobacillus halotolerans]|uniref:LapA family protein n=1 Tax=Oceanobacillus halotolerans TaxID=2663380 RepID=UPI0013D9CB1B|nr:LapA family protein [Oceanobacillus halotolerans]